MTTRLETGDQAPGFTLADDTGKRVSLSDFAGRTGIVYFYPAAMTPGCTTQACDFSDSIETLRKDGYEVLGISKDSPAKLATFRERDHLTITLLSDTDLTVHRAYGAVGRRSSTARPARGCCARPSSSTRPGRSATPSTTSRPLGTLPSCAAISASRPEPRRV